MEIKRTARSDDFLEKNQISETDQTNPMGENSGIADIADSIESSRAQKILNHIVDLDRVEDEYIGETEKNLGQTFEESEKSDAVLLFDEADELFGESPNSDSTDSDDKIPR